MSRTTRNKIISIVAGFICIVLSILSAIQFVIIHDKIVCLFAICFIVCGIWVCRLLVKDVKNIANEFERLKQQNMTH